MSKKILTIISLFAAMQSSAQTSTIKELSEVIVTTANKVEQKQNSTGKVITVIGKEQIEKSSGKTVAEVLNEQAGIVVSGSSGALGTPQTIFMRGADEGRVLILLDGIPVNDPSQINSDFDLNLFSINDVEKIEICKGAQSTLYGSDAIAGVINIITIKNDVSKPFNTKITAAGGTYNTFKGNVQVYGKVNKFIYTVRYAKLTTDGFSTAKDTFTVDDKDGYSSDATNASVQYQATKNLLFKTYVMYSRYKAGIDAAAFSDETNDFIKNNYLSTGGGFQFKNDAVTLVGNYQFSQTNRSNQRDSVDKIPFSYYLYNKYFAKTQYVELYASIKLGAGFTLLQGADYRYALMNDQYMSVSGYGPYSSSFPDSSMSQGSMYTSLLYNHDKINVELGGRLNVHSRYGSNYTYTFNPSYAIDDHFRAFGSIASGFKTPSLYQLYDPFAGNKDLQPEKSTSYELGIEHTYKKFSNRFVFFCRDTKSGIAFNYITFQYYNFGHQQARGFEYETKLEPVKNLQILANYTFVTGDEETQNRIDNNDTVYTYLLKRPKSNLNINIAYNITKDFQVSLSGKYVGSTFDLGGYQVPDVPLKSYFLLGGYAEYKLKKYFTIFADVKNITNTKYTEINGYNTQGFNFIAGVRFNY